MKFIIPFFLITLALVACNVQSDMGMTPSQNITDTIDDITSLESIPNIQPLAQGDEPVSVRVTQNQLPSAMPTPMINEPFEAASESEPVRVQTDSVAVTIVSDSISSHETTPSAGNSSSTPPPTHPAPTAGNSVASNDNNEPYPVTDNLERIRVIINLKDPVDVAADNNVRISALGAVQANVLSAISTQNFLVTDIYSHVPALAGYATVEGIALLEAHPDVASVAPDMVTHISLTETSSLINANDVNNLGYTGAGVRVAVLDSGIDTNHIDLADDLVAQKCFLSQADCPGLGVTTSSYAEDGNGHGTHVSGIITGRGIVAPVGIAKDAEIIAIKVVDDNGYGQTSDSIAALNWLIANHSSGLNLQTDVINISLSWRVYRSTDACDNATSNVGVKSAIDQLRALGVTTFAASGNNALKTHISAPACISSVVGVGASYDANGGKFKWTFCSEWDTSYTDKIICFSNRDAVGMVDIFAPGGWIRAPWVGGGAKTAAGTSLASPTAAGVAALMVEAAPDISPTDLIDIMINSTDVMIDDTEFSGGVFPRVDALASLYGLQSCSVVIITEISSTECEALTALYLNTGGLYWINNSGWFADQTPCSDGIWYGLTCSGVAPYTITGIALGSNNLIGTLPAELGNLSNLTSLDLSNNQVSGSFPNLASLTNLTTLNLSNNALLGEVSDITGLSSLATVDIGYNALTASEPMLTFLNTKDPDWKDTQTGPPINIVISEITSRSITLSWTSILYIGDSGYYEISYALDLDGPWTVSGITTDKSAMEYTIERLPVDENIYVRVRTYTLSHGNQKNNLWSEYTETIATTTDPLKNLGYVDNITPIFSDLGEGNYHIMIVVSGVYPISCGGRATIEQEINVPSPNHLTISLYRIISQTRACSASTQPFLMEIRLTSIYTSGTIWYLHINGMDYQIDIP